MKTQKNLFTGPSAPLRYVPVTPAFAGITSAGLYQINIAPLPSGLGSGDVSLRATVGGAQTPSGVVVSLQ